MRILIVGAGVAGLTLAALLRRQGHALSVIDRLPEGADEGYVLALWPQGSRVLHALGVYDAFVAESEPMISYPLRDGRGRLGNSNPMPASIRRFGQLGAIARPELIPAATASASSPAPRLPASTPATRTAAPVACAPCSRPIRTDPPMRCWPACPATPSPCTCGGLAFLRDRSMRYVSMEQMVGPIIKQLRQPI